MARKNAGKILIMYWVRKRILDRRRSRRRLRQSAYLSMVQHNKMKRRKLFALMQNQGRKKASIWAYPREENWFADMWKNRFVDHYQGNRWREDFRMKGGTFAKLVDVLTPYVQKRDTNFRSAIPVEKRVAIGVWRLATGNAFRTIAKTFAVGKATALHIVHEFCEALSRLSSTFVKFPRTPLELGKAIHLFKEEVKFKIPQAFAAVDGTHIEIQAPNCLSKTDYFSRTKRYTVNTQCIVGANLIFYSVATGYPGSCHDARVWAESRIGKFSVSGALKFPEEIIDQVKVKPLLLGDSAYPLSVNLLKPYPFLNALTPEEKKFNVILSGARVTVERGIGILKARWRILLKRLDATIENVSDVIITCVVLHNFCQFENDEFSDDDGILDELIRRERRAKNMRRQHGGTTCAAGNHLRDVIKRHVMTA